MAATPFNYLLPTDPAETPDSSSAYEVHCRLVEEFSASSAIETMVFLSTDKT
jgi:hypothetical protein